MPIKAVIFDMDGTLLDTVPVVVNGWKKSFQTFANVNFSDVDVMDSFGGDERSVFRSLAKKGNVSENLMEKVLEGKKFFIEENSDKIKAFPGALKFLGFLKKKNIPCVIVSAAPSVKIPLRLKQAGVSFKFKALLGAESTKRPKPDTMPFRKAAKILGKKPKEILSIGDSRYDIIPSKQVGFMTVGVTTGAHTAEELVSSEPDFIVQSLEKLEALFN